MKYTEQAFDRAELELRRRQDNANEEHQRRLDEIAQNAPEIYRMHSEAIRLNYALIGKGEKYQPSSHDARDAKGLRLSRGLLADALSV